MFMIDMQGTFAFATASSSSRTPGAAVLRLLHGQCDEIVFGRIDACRSAGGHLARQLARIDLDEPVRALDRHAHPEAFAVDQVRLGGKAYQSSPYAPP